MAKQSEKKKSGGKNARFWSHLYTLKLSFYQDRLGRNIGKQGVFRRCVGVVGGWCVDGATRFNKRRKGQQKAVVARSRVAAAVTAFSHLTLACGCRRVQWRPQAPPPTNASCPQRTGSCEPHDTARCCSDRRGATSSLQHPDETPCFLNFAYVCPEPVLVKRSLFNANGSHKSVFPAPWWKETSPSCMASVTTAQFSRLTCSQTALSDSSEILIACSPVPCGARRWLPTANIIGPISSGQSQRGIQALIVGVPSIFKGQYCTSHNATGQVSHQQPCQAVSGAVSVTVGMHPPVGRFGWLAPAGRSARVCGPRPAP